MVRDSTSCSADSSSPGGDRQTYAGGVQRSARRQASLVDRAVELLETAPVDPVGRARQSPDGRGAGRLDEGVQRVADDLAQPRGVSRDPELQGRQ